MNEDNSAQSNPSGTKKSIWRWLRWVLLLLVVLVVLAGAFIIFSKKNSEPPTITANIFDINKIEKISKFRSCQGHAVVPQDGSETIRNMKHYVVLKPEYQGKNTEVYAPFNGIVSGIRSNPESGLEGEISLGVHGNDWELSFLHLNIESNIKEGQKVKAGEVIGHAADKGVDVVYSTSSNETKMIDGFESPYSALDSIFNHMSDEVLAEYQAKGLNKNNFIYAKESRDKNPCRYLVGDQVQDAQLNDYEHPEDWVYIK